MSPDPELREPGADLDLDMPCSAWNGICLGVAEEQATYNALLAVLAAEAIIHAEEARWRDQS